LTAKFDNLDYVPLYTMSSTADNLSAVLDAAREALPEGDYLKVANFLPSLLKKDETMPYNVSVFNDLNITIDFKTVKGAKYTIKIDNVSIREFRGSDPNITLINGSINRVNFVDMEESKFLKKIKTIVLICGIINIRRTVDDIVEEWDHYTQFKITQHEISSGGDEEYDESEYLDTTDKWYIARLVCSQLWSPYQ
jgi:hypothetical protein